MLTILVSTLILKPNVEKLQAKGDVKGLIKALRHKDSETACSAAYALGELGQPEAVPALIRSLSQTDDFRLQEASASALGEIGGEEAADALAEVANAWAEGFQLGQNAAVGLAECGDQRAVEPLRQLLAEDVLPPGRMYDALSQLDHVFVTIRISSPIQGSREFEGEYKAALPLDVDGPQLLGAIANSIIWPGQGRVYTGFSLQCPDGTLSSKPGEGAANLREAGVENGAVLELSDSGGTFVGERRIIP